MSASQVERVARRLERATPTQLRVVVTHQPVAVIRPQDEVDLLHGAAAAVRRWSGAGADLILGGHIHLPHVAPLHEQMLDLPRKLWGVQAGTAVSRRIRHEAGNSFNIIRHEAREGHERRAVIERLDYIEARDSFELVDTRELFLEGTTREG